MQNDVALPGRIGRVLNLRSEISLCGLAVGLPLKRIPRRFQNLAHLTDSDWRQTDCVWIGFEEPLPFTFGALFGLEVDVDDKPAVFAHGKCQYQEAISLTVWPHFCELHRFL